MNFFQGLQGCRNSNASSKQNSLNLGVIPICKPKLKADQAKLLAAHKHSESERRRRMRINAQYATLRTILPNLIKMDKASVLAETIRRVRELKKAVEEVEEVCCTVPNVDDELSLEVGEDREEAAGLVLIKATLSCDDRPGLMLELINALKSVKGGVELRVEKTEMMTAGGRTKTVLWLRRIGAGSGGGGGGYEHEHDDDNEAILVMLRRALKVVLAKRANGKC